MCAKFETCDPSDLIKRVDKELAQVTAGLVTTAAVKFRVTNPSKKIHLTLLVYARPGNNGAGVSPGTHDYSAETWQLVAVAPDNPEVVLNNAFSAARPLPDSFDVADGVKLIFGTLNITGNNQPLGDIYKVVAIWEPIDSAMTIDERKYWFARCEISAEKNALQTVGNGT